MKAARLAPGDEFTTDGKTWQILREEVKYYSEDSDNLDLWCQPVTDSRLVASFHLVIPDNTIVWKKSDEVNSETHCLSVSCCCKRIHPTDKE